MKAILCFSLGFLGSLTAAPIINEIVSSNASGLQDEDEAFPDWFELYNPDDAPYDLEGHFLTDDPEGQPERWQFPEVILPPKGFLVVFASGKDRRDPTGNLHTNFRLNNAGETLALSDPDNQPVDTVVFPRLSDGQSYIPAAESGESLYGLSENPTPGEPNEELVVFSRRGRAFTDTFTLELSSTRGGTIRYTEDGKRPTLFNGRNYNGPITIDRTKMISASAGGGPLLTEVFIKIDPELAERSSNIPLVIADASDRLNQTDLKEMAFAVIDRSSASEDGRATLLGEFSLGTRGGIRTRGETSNSFPKKPLRVEFWDVDGEDRNLAPLGMPAESDWVLNARYSFDRTLMHNAWVYELSNQMGRYAPRTRFVELYLNDGDAPVSESDYQGIYTFMENIARDGDRVDVERLSLEVTEEPEITGGYIFKKDKTDPGTWNFTGGSEPLQMVSPAEEEQRDRQAQEAWISDHLNAMRDAIREHGPDPEQGYPAYIETQAWLDHHLLNFLPNNVDALRLSAYFHKPRGGKVVAGPIWDFDRSAGGPSDGRIANPLQWGDGGGGTAFFVRGNHGTPVWWQDLFETPEFLQAWVDRWHALRHSEDVTPTWDPDAEPLPAFSEANINRIFDSMAAEIMEAQARNFETWRSARPRSASQLSYSDIGGFEGEIEHIKGWLAARIDWVEDQLITVPTFTPDPDATLPGNSLEIDVRTGGTLFNPAVVYYTLDGSDPRALGGEPNPHAARLTGDLTLTESARVFARRIDESYEQDRWGPALRWSGPANAYFFVDTVPATAENLVFSEIMYHPSAPSEEERAAGFTDQDDFEFIECLNISDARVDLTGARLRGAADFNFADGTILEPGDRLVLVGNREAFTQRYGDTVAVAGSYDGQLGNGGAVIRLRNHERQVIREFRYGDDAPWPEDADGEGRALVLVSPSTNPDPGAPESWVAGTAIGGTPGSEEGSGDGGQSPIEGLQDWLAAQLDAAQLADPAISGPAADADGDGLPTLFEFLVEGRVLVADPDAAPTIRLVDGHAQFRYPTSPNASQLTIRLESSTDLTTWEPTPAPVTQADGMTIHSLPRDAPARYLRLRLSND